MAADNARNRKQKNATSHLLDEKGGTEEVKVSAPQKHT